MPRLPFRFRLRRPLLVAMLVAVLGAVALGAWQVRKMAEPPRTRLAAGQTYPELPPDDHHLYLQLPLDHADPSRGTFTAFYILSPRFRPGDQPVFMLFDNQQEAVGMVRAEADFRYFDDLIGPNMSYVLIGNRGVSPTLFPEVFRQDGTPDLTLALRLYGSDQQVEDIEAVRQDMVRRNLLSGEGRIHVMGGSGGGVLVQQFLAAHGDRVDRALLVSTGAPDLSASHGVGFGRPLAETNPEAAAAYAAERLAGRMGKARTWAAFRLGLFGDYAGQTEVVTSRWAAFWRACNPSFCFPLANFIMQMPQELEVRVRMWELVGADIVAYRPTSAAEINLLNEIVANLLPSFLDAYHSGQLPARRIVIDRTRFQGEVMVWANTGDQDFGPERGRWLAEAYPRARLFVFDDRSHHRLEATPHQVELMKAFFKGGLAALAP